MTIATLKHKTISLQPLLILCLLLFSLSATAQDPKESKRVIQDIQSLSNRNSLPNAKDIVLKVIEGYNKTSFENSSFYHYNSYRKTSVDIIAPTDSIESQLDKIKNSPDFLTKLVLQPFEFTFNYALSAVESNKSVVTLLLFEDYKSIFADNINNKKGETIHASQKDGIFDVIGHNNISSFLDEVFGDVNLFKETSNLMLLSFKSPLNSANTDIYTYKLQGQKTIDGITCNEIAFFCPNMKENAFAGNLYITTEDSPKLIKAEFTFNNRESANFLQDILLTHYFDTQDSIITPTQQDGVLFLGKDNKRVLAAKRTDIFLNYDLEKPKDDLKWKISREKNYFKRDSTYWAAIRPIPFNETQKQMGELEKAAEDSKKFRRLERIINLAMSGSYIIGGQQGKVELSPILHFLSYNNMEGLRVRVGGNTTIKLSDQLQVGGYLAYGSKDKKLKQQANVVYSLFPKEKYLWEYPKKVISLTYASDLNIPGQDILVMNRDHFSQSFSHTPTNNMSLQRVGLLTFESETPHNVTYKIGGKITYDRPIGVVQYAQAISPTDTTIIDNIKSSDLIFSLRFAPGERFIQRKEKQTAIRRAAFELNITYKKGLKGVFGADYNYNSINFDLFKRFDLAKNRVRIDTYLSGGKIWGAVPFPLLFIPEGNQSYIFSATAYNCMNFYEFATDRFVAGSFNSTFDWSPVRIFNAKDKTKLCLGAKMIYGPLSESNDPSTHPELFVFDNGIKPLSSTPYSEFNVGVANIFKILRVDYSRRLSYTNSIDARGKKISNGTILVSGSFSF